MPIEFLDSITISGDLSASGKIYWGDNIQYKDGSTGGGGGGGVGTTLKFVGFIGNNTQTEYTVTHNLSTEHICVNVYERNTKSMVFVYTQILNLNSIKIIFADPPGLFNGGASYKVVVIG